MLAQPELETPAEFWDEALPLIATEQVPLCAVCGNAAFKPFATGFDYESKTCRNPWTFVECSKCGHVWLNPRPAISTLSVIYPKTYYAYSYKTQINPIAVKAKELLDDLKMRKILAQLQSPPRSFLDIGCGDGRFLKLMERKGVPRKSNYGLELDAGVVEQLAKEGYPVFCERVEDCQAIPENSIDLITMFHVIEHVNAPDLVVRQIAKWLSPKGVLALETPNLDSIDARMFKRTYWGGYHIPRHWHLFTQKTLAKLLESSGLTVLGTLFQTGHSFWMYSFHHSLRYSRPARVGLAKLFHPLKSVVPLAMFTGLDKARAALGQRTSAMLMLARKP
jgi:2-polyprenyl-3-methyl-5-hydroxy-6-metoxy-1,4-benzoquinol methylase